VASGPVCSSFLTATFRSCPARSLVQPRPATRTPGTRAGTAYTARPPLGTDAAARPGVITDITWGHGLEGTTRPRLGRSCIPCRCALSSGGINRTNECKTGEVSDRSRLATRTHQLPNRPCISRGRGGVSRLSWSSGLAKTTSLAAWAGLAPPAVLITLQIRPRESSGRSSAEGSRSMHAAARSWASHRRHDRVHSGSTLRLRGPGSQRRRSQCPPMSSSLPHSEVANVHVPICFRGCDLHLSHQNF
jgi:hypothetical protein